MSDSGLDVKGEMTNHDQTNRDVHVRRGGRLVQRGQVNGDVTVDAGGTLFQHGQVNGDIHAYGQVVLSGQVNGDVHAYDGADVLISEGVMIGRRPKRYVAPDGTFQPVPERDVFSTQVGPNVWRLMPDGQLAQP